MLHERRHDMKTHSEPPSFEAVQRQLSRTLWIIGTLVAALSYWVYSAKLDMVATATGVVIPADYIKVLQNLEGGIVTDILVRPGDPVQKGQPLMRLSRVQYESELEGVQTQIAALTARAVRLNAEISGKTGFQVPSQVIRQAPQIVSGEEQEFYSRQQRLEGLRTSLEVTNMEREMVAKLVSQGLEPRAELLRVTRDANERQQAITGFLEQASTEYNKIQAEIQTKTELLRGLHDKISRTSIISPIDGVVGHVHISTTTGVIRSGEPLIDIIPVRDELIIEARLAPADIAQVRIGTEAKIKLSAYDFSIFGSIPGEVIYVSADVLKPDPVKQPNANQPYYLVKIRSKISDLPASVKKIDLVAGMDAQIDFITGQRTIAQYLFKPLQTTLDRAFKEK